MNRSNQGALHQSKGGSDFLQLSAEDAPEGGLSDWLAASLRAAISDGRLPIGSRLPATRVLAADLRVSRGVVTEAYQRLTEDGHIVGRGRAGTVVVAIPHTPKPGPPGKTKARPERPKTVFDSPPGVEVFEAARAAPARIDLSPGVPDLASFPRAAWLRAERAVLSELSAVDFGYGDPRGAPAMRAAVATWLARNRGITVDPAEVIIVAGVAQTLDLLAQILQQDGVKTLAVEDPGSLGTRQQFHHRDIATPPVTVDEDGIRVDELRATGAPAVLLTPAHHFPTGVVLGGERRRELMRWASEGGLIVEDDYDAEHRYDRPPVPAIRSMLAEQVCYTGSVSKLLAPALRVGWVLPPPKYREAFVAAKRFADLGNAVLPQLVLAHLMDSGELERQLRFLRRRHRQRRDAMITAIREYLPEAKVHGAAAGLHLMITFDSTAFKGNDAKLAAEILARGVKVQPLSWHHQRPARPGLVLGYAANNQSDLAEGIATIAEALHHQ